jgi:aminopeptidase N
MQPLTNQRPDPDRPDPHSYFRTDQPRLQHVEWAAAVDFDTRMLECRAVLTFDRSGVVDLDTRDLNIETVTTSSGSTKLEYELAPAEPVIGSRLRVHMVDGDRSVAITYLASPTASALQWLTPEQTMGKRHSFLFSQGECIHTRSFLPCQDSPGVRFTYNATLSVPRALRGLMAAEHVKREEESSWAHEHWRMDHPIPAYLMAFAVGDLASRNLSPRSRVWAEPKLADKAAWECADVERMMAAAEKLFGPYLWGRFDILFLPPSFPYGGMENPTLTFLTPGIVTGDRSAVNVVAHELAHAWTGNLVTNATWSDFWLNEGWTTYAEMRIIEELYGRDSQELQAALLKHELERDLARFANEPQLTHLYPHIPGSVDPDDTFSRVPYCKGYLFLRMLEETVGRERFDAFIRMYIERFGFRTIDTAAFLDVVAAELPGTLLRVDAKAWVYGPGLPENCPTITSATRDTIAALAIECAAPTDEQARAWNGAAWAYYLQSIPRFSGGGHLCLRLDERFRLSRHGNAEIQFAWFLLAVETFVLFEMATGPRGKFLPATYDDLEQFLATNGRLKYLRPLYTALAKQPPTHAWARKVFDRVKAGYHPVAQSVIGKLLAEEPKAT